MNRLDRFSVYIVAVASGLVLGVTTARVLGLW